MRWRRRCASRPTWVSGRWSCSRSRGRCTAGGAVRGLVQRPRHRGQGPPAAPAGAVPPALAARAVHRRAAAHLQQAHARVRDGASTGDDRPGGVLGAGAIATHANRRNTLPLARSGRSCWTSIAASGTTRWRTAAGSRWASRRATGRCADLRPAGTGDRAPGDRRHDRRRARAGVRPERALGDARGRGRAERPPRVPADDARGAGGALPHPRRASGGLPRPPRAREPGRQRGRRLSAPGGAESPVGLRRTVDFGAGGARPRSGAIRTRAYLGTLSSRPPE